MLEIQQIRNQNRLSRGRSISAAPEFRLNYSEQMPRPYAGYDSRHLEQNDEVSFKGKKGTSVQDSKKIINSIKKKVGEIAKEHQPEKKRGDKVLTGSLFDWMLRVAGYEALAQAAIAAVVCMLIRPLTIMSLPGKNHDDNVYASSHSFASGLIGLATSFILTTPFKSGQKYVMQIMRKNLNESTLQRLYPHLKTESIWADAAKKVRKPMEEWKDTVGNEFSDELKNVDMLTEFRQLADAGENTFKDILKVDADWAKAKGQSFNDVKLKNGRNLYDEIDMSKLGIVVEEEGMKKAQILLRDLDKDYLEKVVSDSKGSGSNWGNLDVKSVYDANGAVKDFRQWKDLNGKQWKLDLDEVFVSSPYETTDKNPRISGKKRYDEREKIYKFSTYQANGSTEKLGTEITSDMVNSERENEALQKFLTWLPDLVFRIPVAASTIALIPFVLKYIFRVEKPSAKSAANTVNEPLTQNKPQPAEDKEQNTVSFKGKGDPKKASWFAKWFGKIYGKPLIESENCAKFSKMLSKLPGGITQHMSVFGSLITSSVYVQQTLTKKELDPERRRTLAVNQILCFIIPTFAAYFADNRLNDFIKKTEYRYVGLQKGKIEKLKSEGTEEAKKAAEELTKELSEKSKGVRILGSLAIFTLIYRYLTPVVVTPIANKIGAWWNEKKKAKEEVLKETKV